MSMFSGKLLCYQSPYRVELLGCCTTFQYICDYVQGLRTVEIDAQLVHNTLISSEEDHSKFGFTMDDWKESLNLRQNVSIKWVRRNCNKVAHQIERVACFYPFFHVWDSLPPNIVVLLYYGNESWPLKKKVPNPKLDILQYCVFMKRSYKHARLETNIKLHQNLLWKFNNQEVL